MSPQTNVSADNAVAVIAIQIAGMPSAARRSPGVRSPTLYGNTNRPRNGPISSAGGASASASTTVTSAYA